MQLDNTTPFAAERVILQDAEGRDLLVVLVKCTYSLKNLSRLNPVEEQVPVQMADEYYGEPGQTSVRYESDIVPRKTGTDIFLLGHAYAARTRVSSLDVALRVGGLKRTIRVFGNRYWRKTLGFWRISSPEPFARMPLVFERAYGGQDTSHSEKQYHESETRNPVGLGFRAKKSKLEEFPLPNLEDPLNLISSPENRPEPTCFGVICRHWQPRLSYIGTCNAQWQESGFPFLPKDFDGRYFNGSRFVYRGFLKGTEDVELTNAGPAGPLSFRLPGDTPNVMLIRGAEEEPLPMQLDIFVLEPDHSRLVLVWRGSKNIYGRLYDAGRILVRMKD